MREIHEYIRAVEFCNVLQSSRNAFQTGKSFRHGATEYAIRLLEKNDILLVAGKGGEYYQEIMGIKHSYNDNTVIKRIIG